MLEVQWTEVKHGERQYNMRPLKCVYGLLPDGLVDFFVMVDNVLRWGILESLVVRLARNTETGLVISEIEQSSFYGYSILPLYLARCKSDM